MVGPVDTSYGVMENVTGTGYADVRYELREIATGSDWRAVMPDMNLSGRDQQGAFWVWASSSTPSFTVELDGASNWAASRIGETVACGGVHFGGDAGSEWNRFGTGGASDCVIGRELVSGDDLGLGLLLAGAALTVGVLVAVLRWHTRRAGSDKA